MAIHIVDLEMVVLFFWVANYGDVLLLRASKSNSFIENQHREGVLYKLLLLLQQDRLVGGFSLFFLLYFFLSFGLSTGLYG